MKRSSSCHLESRMRGAGWRRLAAAVDSINGRYARTLVGYGGCAPPGGYAGAKIAYGRIPQLEDFQ